MTTKISSSFKMRLLALFLVISAVPLLLAVGMSTVNMVSDAYTNMENEGTLRNRLAQEKISELYEKNLNALRILAANPMIRHYLSAEDAARDPQVRNVLDKANKIFDDGNNIILTGTDGQQLYRTDDRLPVNIQKRWYFREAMEGREAISEVVVSLATGRFISVVEVPVLDADGKAIGLVQRDYNLGGLQKFVESLATEDTHVVVLDRDGRVLAHSLHPVETEKDRVDETGYAFVGRALLGESGSLRADIHGQDMMVSYSRNELTGWVVVTAQAGAYVQNKIYSGAAEAVVFGLALLCMICVAAYLLADTIARPIIDLNNTMRSVVRNNHTDSSTPGGDELSQMAEAIDKIQSTTDILRKESEMDKLTGLHNKAATEAFCRASLAQLEEDALAALYIIDLDHFKEVNDTKGHQFGDRVLKEFADRLRHAFRVHDCIGRFGGDEYVVFVTGMPGDDVILRKASQILAAARDLSIDGTPAGVTASIGIATATCGEHEYETLFASADKYLYAVKENGRNGCCLDGGPICRESQSYVR